MVGQKILVPRWAWVFIGLGTAGLGGCTESASIEATSRSSEALSATAARVLGMDAISDWTASGATLASGARHRQGTGSVALSSLTYATLTSRALSTLGSAEIGSIIGFDIQIPEFQPNPSYFGAVELYVDLPSRGLQNVLVGQKELTYLPRGNFRRVEFTLSSTVQAALRATYSDLRLRFALNTPGGTGPYLLDRISFTHEESEPIDNSRNANILGFETTDSWVASPGQATRSSDRTDRAASLSVLPSGYTVITSDRLATPSDASALVGFDLKMPSAQTGWVGETQLYVDLPSQNIFNAYVGRHELSTLRPDAFNRVSYTLPSSIVSKLTEAFDDLRFKIVLNTPAGSGPYLLDRFRFGEVADPAETIDIPLTVPRNLGSSDMLLVATESLRLGTGVRIEPADDPRLAVVSLGAGGVNLGADSEVDSVVSYGPVSVGANARVRGYVGGAADLSTQAGALIWGEVLTERAPLVSTTLRESFGPTTNDVSVDAGTLVLEPGRYRDVSVNAGVLRLGNGRYSVDRLIVGSAGRIEYDSREGSPLVAVRTTMQLGTVRDRTVDAGLAPFGAPTWTYLGRDPLDFVGTPPGRLVAPESSVRVTLPPSEAGAATLWGTIGRVIDVAAHTAGSSALRPGFAVRTNTAITATLGVEGFVSISTPDEPFGSSEEDPLTVYSDNPMVHGSFDWRPNESATNACPPWFNTGTWQGIEPATLTLWRLRPGQTPAQAWSAPLLPGYFLHFLAPLIREADSCEQTPETWPQAFFDTRAFNLWHRTKFRVAPSLVHSNGERMIPGAGAPELFMSLSPETLIVPVVVIDWDGEQRLDDYRALFDFIPSREISPDVVPPARPPSPPYTSPATLDFPPDRVFNRCGIQFRLVRALHLGPREPLRPYEGNNCNAPDNVCRCAPGVGFDPGLPDYVHDEVLSERLHAALGSEFDELFGPSGLRPMLVQYGSLPDGCGYAGKGASQTLRIADVNIQGVVQINTVVPDATTAHEMGHALGLGHVSQVRERLMNDPTPGKLVVPSECVTARGIAAGPECELPRVQQAPRVDRHRLASRLEHEVSGGHRARGLVETEPVGVL